MMPKRTGFDFSPMLVGSIVQLVTGIALIPVRMISGMGVIEEKMIVKLVIAIIVLALVILLLVRQRRFSVRQCLLAPRMMDVTYPIPAMR